MGLYKRPQSPYWHIWLENAPPGQQRIKTAIRIGTTKLDREKSKAQAEQLYGALLLERSARIHRLDPERPTIRFAAFARWYDEHHIAKHKGAEREREILPRFVAAFGDRLIAQITKMDVEEWRTRRLRTPSAIPTQSARRGKLPTWLRVHQYLVMHGTTQARVIRAALELPDHVSHYVTAPNVAGYFACAHGGFWTAVGTPELGTRTLPRPTPQTVNREVALLKQMLAAAVPTYLDASPLKGMADLPTTPPIRRTMSREEEAAVLEQLSPVDRAILLCGLDGLIRMGDILDLLKEHDRGDSLAVVDPKNRRPRLVPVSARLRAALDALPASDSKYLFPSRRRASTAAARRNGVAQALERACARAGVPYGRAANGLTFHWSTRRTGATRMIRKGGDRVVAVVQQVGGWENPDVLLAIYQEVSAADMRQAVESVSADDSQSTRSPDELSQKLA